MLLISAKKPAAKMGTNYTSLRNRIGFAAALCQQGCKQVYFFLLCRENTCLCGRTKPGRTRGPWRRRGNGVRTPMEPGEAGVSRGLPCSSTGDPHNRSRPPPVTRTQPNTMPGSSWGPAPSGLMPQPHKLLELFSAMNLNPWFLCQQPLHLLAWLHRDLASPDAPQGILEEVTRPRSRGCQPEDMFANLT